MTEVPTREMGTEDSRENIRAAVYCRTSSRSQRFGYSIGEQARVCVEQCGRRGWEVVYLFRDEVQSGKDNDRPMFQQMVQAAQQGLIDVVVVWKLDRISRSVVHAVELEAGFRELKVAILSITEQIDTTTPAGRFNFRNMANVAELEREMIRERSQMGRVAAAREGKWPNASPPLGYRKAADGRLKIDQTERALVEEIFQRYLKTKSMLQVADHLNQRGDTTKSGGEWTPRAVGDILRNPIYMGVFKVGDCSRFIPEYQFISHPLFHKTTRVRRRFVDGSARKTRMEQSRKQRYINRILKQYSEYLQARPDQPGG